MENEFITMPRLLLYQLLNLDEPNARRAVFNRVTDLGVTGRLMLKSVSVTFIYAIIKLYLKYGSTAKDNQITSITFLIDILCTNIRIPSQARYLSLSYL